MRLLYFDTTGGSRRLLWRTFSRKTIPPYAILSHTWGDDEFLFENLANNTGEGKAGYEKILFCGEQAARDSLQYFWVDTCCIDKWNLPELSNAINSMFQWYKDATKCYALLDDVSTPTVGDQVHQDIWNASFRESRWFKRGWTLQELLAPASVDFFSSERQPIGDKVLLEQQICEITRIPATALRGEPLDNFAVSERMAWIGGRETELEEDMAYSLIGIFNVAMESRYNEGKERAMNRLQEEIDKAKSTPFIVPLDQNSQFVGRESQIVELKRKLFVGPSTTKVAITGPGGIGKTQLALELAYSIRQELKDCSIFWISARDKYSIHQAYARIARRLAIPGWEDEEGDVKKLVKKHLSKESAGQWLLVVDNADEATTEPAGSFEVVDLMEYLPSSEQGAIVFTTADRETATRLAPHDIVELPEMDHEMSQKMLENCLVHQTTERQEMGLLLRELAYLPLAIVHAASYINVNKIKLQEYLSLLVKRKEKLSEDLQQDSTNVIAATWLVSFEQILQHDTLAAAYLIFMACVDRNDIPLAILPTATPREQQMHAVETLHAYSLVTKRTVESALDLHRLVHVSTRNWLSKLALLSEATQKTIERLLKVFPNDDHGSRSKWRRLLPHAKFAVSSDPNEHHFEARADLMWKCAKTLLSDGRWEEAEVLLVQVIGIEKRVLGEEHPPTLASISTLATTYQKQGRWKEAEELEVQVIEIEKRVLGEEHPDTLTSISNLASTYWNQGRWKEAEELFVQVLEIRRRVLGEEHPDTLASISNLGTTYWNQGRWKEAEELEVQVLEIQKRVLGEEHPDTLTTMANLASTLKSQGRK